MTFYKKQGGEYRLMPMTYPMSKVCSMVNNDDYWATDAAKHSNMTFPMACPFESVCKSIYVLSLIQNRVFYIQKTYMIKQFKPNIPEELLIFLDEGDYGARTELFHEEKAIFECWTYVGIIKFQNVLKLD
jgi:hypothetical protein